MMFIDKMLNIHRNDFSAIIKCEHCGATEKLTSGYNDNYYHHNVIPAFTCPKCRKNRAGIKKPTTPAAE